MKFWLFLALCVPACIVAQDPLVWTEVHSGPSTLNLAQGSGSGSGAGAQSRQAASTPGIRYGGALGYDNKTNTLILFGGVTTGRLYPNDTWIYDIANGRWSEVPVAAGTAPEGRFRFYYGVVDVNGVSLFIISHGVNSSGPRVGEVDDTWAFNMATLEWNRVIFQGSQPGPGERYGGHFGALYGPSTNEFWMGGGFTETTPLQTRYIDTYILEFSSPTTAVWREVWGQPSLGNQYNPLVPIGRCLQGSAVVNRDRLVLYGGCSRQGYGGGPCPNDDVWYLDITANRWRDLPRCATPRVWSHMAPLSNDPGKAILYGGSTTVVGPQVFAFTDWPEDEVLVIDVDGREWSRYSVNGTVDGFPGRRFEHMMAAGPNGYVYLYGGRGVSNTSLWYGDLWRLGGTPGNTPVLGCDNVWFSYAHLHGLLNAVAFGILFPIGFIVARFHRCRRSKAWFIIHVCLQMTGVIFTIPAFILIWFAGASRLPTHPHAIIGIFLQTITLIQPLIGIFRPHIKDDGEKSLYRKIWEWIHRIWGLSVILLGFAQVTLGVFLISPPRGVWIAWLSLLGSWVIHFIVAEIIRCACWCYWRGRDSSCEGDKDIEMKKKHP